MDIFLQVDPTFENIVQKKFTEFQGITQMKAGNIGF